MLKWWRPGVALITGMSGVGKSTLVNTIVDDFTNPRLNPNADKPAAVLYFNYETPATSELIRTVSAGTDLSYAHILSSEYDASTNSYNTLTDSEYDLIVARLKELETRPIEYITDNGGITAMTNTVKDFVNDYPGHRPVIVIDHSLLVRKADGSNDGDLIQDVAIFGHDMYRMYGAIVIIIHLFNNDILKPERILTPALHYPRQSDLYYGSQLYWACDDVIVIHDPASIGISSYGSQKWHLAGHRHIYKLKSRFGVTGHIIFQDSLKTGKFVELTVEQSNSLKGVKKSA